MKKYIRYWPNGVGVLISFENSIWIKSCKIKTKWLKHNQNETKNRNFVFIVNTITFFAWNIALQSVNKLLKIKCKVA